MIFLKSIIGFVLSLFKKDFDGPGLLLDSPEVLASLPRHELFFGASGGTPDWMSLCPPFRYQGPTPWCTAYAGTSIASTLERHETGKTVLFSPMELFYRSNGGVAGNYLVRTAEAMKDCLVLEEDLKTQIPSSWGVDVWKEYNSKATAPVSVKDTGKRYAIKSFASVIPNKSFLRDALVQSPLMLAVGVGKGYWSDPAPQPPSYSAFHAVELLSIDYDGSYVIFDSLTQKQDFDGVHRLASNYDILAALSFVDLPNDWFLVQEKEIKKKYPGALDNYGMKRDLGLEQRSAKALTLAAKKNPTVAAYIGRNFLIYVNAVSYAGYSIQDVLNSTTSIRRGGKALFDFNKLRKDNKIL